MDKKIEYPESFVNFQEFFGLFENPLNVVVSNLRITRYKKWYIQVDVSYTDPETEETVSKTMTLGEIN